VVSPVRIIDFSFVSTEVYYLLKIRVTRYSVTVSPPLFAPSSHLRPNVVRDRELATSATLIGASGVLTKIAPRPGSDSADWP
jgi:hypothetical protein